jgi:hypothetical protein
VSVSGARFATAGSIPAKLEYVVRQGYISRHFFHFCDLTYFKRDTQHLKKSNAFKLPIFGISILKDEKKSA